MLRSLTLLAATCAAMTLTACVGGGVVHNKKQVFMSFRVGTMLGTRVLSDGGSKQNPSAKMIRSAWGAPDGERSVKRDIVWTYKTEPSFSGVVPMVGIGIPLVIPTGSNGIDIFFSGHSDIPYKAEERTTTWSGGYYGPKDEAHSESGFHKLTD